MNKYYIIYKTTNLINNKYYIGKHETYNLNDSYIGSGKALIQALKKYGRQNFKFEILYFLNSQEEMNKKEKEIITEEFVKNPNTYNLTLGGEGGPIFKGKKHSEKTKELLRTNHKKVLLTEKQKEEIVSKSRQTRLEKYGSWTSEEIKQKISLSSRSKKQKIKKTKEEIKKSISEKLKGHIVTEETRKKLSLKNKGQKPKNKGKICITKDNLNKYIYEKDLENYLKEGWIKGTKRNYSIV